MKRIIYKNQDNTVSILIPTSEALKFATIEQVAEKDCPYNLPYWIAEDSVNPKDRTFRSAWEIDERFGKPDGFGKTSTEFTDEVLLEMYNAK